MARAVDKCRKECTCQTRAMHAFPWRSCSTTHSIVWFRALKTCCPSPVGICHACRPCTGPGMGERADSERVRGSQKNQSHFNKNIQYETQGMKCPRLFEDRGIFEVVRERLGRHLKPGSRSVQNGSSQFRSTCTRRASRHPLERRDYSWPFCLMSLS